jgi:hypothetical protein
VQSGPDSGVQKVMDLDEPKDPVDPSTPPLAIETMLGYTGSIRTALWYELGRDCGKVGRKHPRIISFLTFSSIVVCFEQGGRGPVAGLRITPGGV